jgi:hypothetical protein
MAAPIMQTSQEFRKFSKQCDRLAEEAETKNQRRTLEELAVAWEKVAEEYEQKTTPLADTSLIGLTASCAKRAGDKRRARATP